MSREQVLEVARGALGALESKRQRLDDLNVFPVADGDTGTNLLLTVRGIVEALEGAQTDERGALAEEVSHFALMAGQGNSGVILSQAVRGAAQALRSSDRVAGALRGASDAAAAAVRRPVEGTMLTVLRELAEEAEAGGDLAAIVARGDDCVTRTTGMLPALREAGVVDAGAAGVVEIVRGIAGVLLGAPLPDGPARAPAPPMHHEPSRFRYCTVFVVSGPGIDGDALERAVAGLGDSLLVVRDSSTVKVHVHTDEPDDALALGRGHGVVSAIEIADMHEQALRREERLAHGSRVTVVVAGEGNRRLFESLGATVVEDESELAAGGADAIVVATAPRSGPAPALEAGSIPAALAAVVAFDPQLGAAENRAAMAAAAAGVATAEVRSHEGRWIGLAEGETVAEGDSFAEVAGAVASELLREPRGLLTLLTGAGAEPLDGVLDSLAAQHPELEIELHEGGQPHSALLLSAE